jgi:predicted nucleotidyltransferase
LARIPKQVSALLQKLAEQLPVLLGKNLVGVYVYGSLTQRAFNTKRSDIDCIVVTHRDLSDGQFRRLEAWLEAWLNCESELNPWITRLQVTFLIKSDVLTMNSRACLYQFGRLTRSGSDGNPIIWMNVLKSGLILLGPPPESFVPAITPEILFQALVRELGYLRDDISQKRSSEWRDVPSYRAYAVLTLCRILYSFKKGTIVSKQTAARWAMKQLSEEWEKIIRQALGALDDKSLVKIPLYRIRHFIDFVDAQLHLSR